MRTVFLLILVTNLFGSRLEIYNIAKQYTKYPSTITAIAGVESSYGKYILGDEGKSLGICQVQVSTLKFIAKKDKRLRWVLKYPNRVLSTWLLRNDQFNIYVACLYFNYLNKHYGYRGAISRYNGGSNNTVYVRKVLRRIR